jgi:hypothetical protein
MGGHLESGLAVESGHNSGGEAYSGAAGLGLGLAEEALVVVDGGQGQRA